MRNSKYLLFMAGLMITSITLAAALAGLPAVVRKDSVSAFSKADFSAAKVATLHRGDHVRVAAQDGLWYQLALEDGATGFVRVNEIRIAEGNATNSADTMHVLLTGKSGRGRVTETAGVRGLGQSELRSAGFDGAELEKMESYRASPRAAASYARGKHWSSTRIAWKDEAGPVGGTLKKEDTQQGISAARNVLGSLGGVFGRVADVAEKAAPESEAELLDVELELGPMIAGRVLGARPLWKNSEAQTRVNLIGRWLASQTSRPDLPWTFGVIDSSEFNAFAAPGGYILVTRGLYELVANDAELASVLAHEITHVVQRDHYSVIRKQGLMSTAMDLASSHIRGAGSLAESLARDYVEKNGASILATGLDRDAEYRADQIGQVYLARAGMNPLAMYAMLQKMAVIGTASGGLAQLYETHPSIDDRLDRIDQRGYGPLAPYLERRVSMQ